MIGVDMSNYTDPLTPENVQALKDADVGLVIVQAVDPPAGYPAGRTRDQIQTCLDAGLVVDAYIWIWFDLDEADIHAKLALLDGLGIHQLWLDVEDTGGSIKYSQVDCEAKVAAALAVCDAYGTTSGFKCGVYSGRWFWTDARYMGNSVGYSDRMLWDANYDLVADAALGYVSYGGWSAPTIKQFRGSTAVAGVGGLDVNALSVAEEGGLLPAPAPDPANPCQEVIDQLGGLVGSLGYIAGDLLKPVVALKGVQSKAVRALVTGIRGQADQHGISHA